jgi:hypothetical protein
MIANIVFETGNGYWHISKKFNDKSHMDNWIKMVCSKKGFLLDEVYINKQK